MRQEHWRAELRKALEVATFRPPLVFYFFARQTNELRIRSSQVIYLLSGYLSTLRLFIYSQVIYLSSNDARAEILRVRKR